MNKPNVCLALTRSLLLVLLASALAGCLSNTSLTDSWQAPGLHRKDMQSVLVVAMTPNITNRLLFERGFLMAMEDRGIHATASYSVLGDAMPNRDSVTAYVKANGITHVMVSQYGGQTVTKEVVPESVRTYYTGPYYPSYGGYWDYHDSTITMTRESYVDTTTTTMLTTSVFEVQSEALVWVGRSKSFEVDSIAYSANDLARQIIGAIRN